MGVNVICDNGSTDVRDYRDILDPRRCARFLLFDPTEERLTTDN